MKYTLDNFVRSMLAADAATTDTSLVLALAASPLRDPPAASVAAPGILILQDSPTAPTIIEIVSYVGVVADDTRVTLSGVTRGLEGTVARQWTTGANVFGGLTSGILGSFASSDEGDLAGTALQPGDGLAALDGAANTKLAGVEAGAQVNVQADWSATSGDAAIKNRPTLGSAALTDSTAYATAAQGSLAQSAVQPNTSPSLTGADINGEVWVRGVSQTTSFDRRQGFGGLLRADGGHVSTGSGGGISMEAFGQSIAVLKGYVTSSNGTGGAMMFVATGSVATTPVMTKAQYWSQDGTSQCYGAFSAPSVTDTSDARLKTNIRRDPSRYRGIRRVVEMVLYDRTSGMSDNEPGVIAQELQKAGCHADDFVGTQNDGTLTVHYGKLALACALDPEGRE